MNFEFQLWFKAHDRRMSRGNFYYVHSIHDRSYSTSFYGGHCFCKIIKTEEKNANATVFKKCSYLPEGWSALSYVSSRRHEKKSHYRSTRQGTDDRSQKLL